MSYTLGQLTTAIIDTTESTDTLFANHVNDFISQAEKRIYNAIPVLTTRQNNTSLTLTANSQYFTLPANWLATYSIGTVSGGSTTYLLPKEPEFIREAYPIPTAVGPPIHYGQYDFQTLIIGPTPDQSYTIEIDYFGYPTSLITLGTNGTTWLSTNSAN